MHHSLGSAARRFGTVGNRVTVRWPTLSSEDEFGRRDSDTPVSVRGGRRRVWFEFGETLPRHWGSFCRNKCGVCAKQHIVQSTVASIITASNALTKNLSSGTRTPAASTTDLWTLR